MSAKKTGFAEPVATVVNGHTFTIDPRYVLKDSRILGKGSFGVVCTAYDTIRKIDLAIKRIRPYANDEWDARHTLREIRLLKLLGPHPNIITLYELSLYEPKTELYMMMELMDCDLHRVIQSKQPLTEKHFKCFVKQILEGIKAMHSVGVFHRDLKPGNILVSKDCQLRITDFGLARFMDDATRLGDNQQNPMTEYVVTRWYRCPELLLSPNIPYSEAVDMWSIGCILAELLRRKPLFPGKSHASQVQLIFEVVGYSNAADLGFPISSEAVNFMDKRCRYRRQPYESLMPEASAEAIQMLEGLLSVNPSNRPSAPQALLYPFLREAEILNDYSKTYVFPPKEDFFDFEHEKYSVPVLKEMIESEVRLSSAHAYQFQDEAHDAPDSPSLLIMPLSSRSTVPSARDNVGGRTQSNQDLSARRLTNDPDDPHAGPASQLPTQANRGVNNFNASRSDKSDRAAEKPNDNPFRSQKAAAAGSNGQPAAAAAISNQQAGGKVNTNQSGGGSNGGTVAPMLKSKSNSDVIGAEESGNVAMPMQAIPDGNILTAVRGSDPLGTARSGKKSAPKTPSPKKMESIQHKDLLNKKRFMMEGQQQQQQQAQQQQTRASSNSSTDRSSNEGQKSSAYEAQWTAMKKSLPDYISSNSSSDYNPASMSNTLTSTGGSAAGTGSGVAEGKMQTRASRWSFSNSGTTPTSLANKPAVQQTSGGAAKKGRLLPAGVPFPSLKISAFGGGGKSSNPPVGRGGGKAAGGGGAGVASNDNEDMISGGGASNYYTNNKAMMHSGSNVLYSDYGRK